MTLRTVVWSGRPFAPAPVGAIVAARRKGPMRVVDDSGLEVRVASGRLLYEALRLAWQRAVNGALAVVAGALTTRRTPPLRRTAGHAAGPVVLVVPVLPDQSHTFVYREVLALLRARPDWRCVVLAKNALAPRHGEAEELAAKVTFLPRAGVTVRAIRVLRWLCRSRGRELFAMYRAQPGGSVGGLLGRRVLREPRDPGNAFELADLLAPMRPCHVHVYSSTHPTNVAMGAAHLLSLPFSISSYVDFEFGYQHKMLAEKVARATFFRVVTKFCAARLLAMPGLPALDVNSVPVVYLGLDLANWRQRAAPQRRGVLLSAARLVPKKGLQFVPAALRILRDRGIVCRWRVIGDGPERFALEAACRERGVADLVEFLGALASNEVRRELLTADLAVLPCVIAADGERDGIPVFLNEAMALAVPVVTTPISGIPEMVRDGETGFLAQPGDSQSLADTIARALASPELARTVGDSGRALVHDMLDVDVTAAQLLARIEA